MLFCCITAVQKYKELLVIRMRVCDCVWCVCSLVLVLVATTH